ncbi:hypothetical protein BU26DRAFT_106637 [Trematosphaeria pertusa]|uniref:Uncharacterized protein n=1 Tax=Trematosphaeria pertusa TaxID=390896 RepID=A0A6A6I061_9PLEO|nr:uncharacterized protein BU26DRAFT_106637 [Trematosphaeria pertusa]KAF2243667.1 hypothetical protein BU26DRAFT_106637 [Trematosphaeria pertusa]
MCRPAAALWRFPRSACVGQRGKARRRRGGFPFRTANNRGAPVRGRALPVRSPTAGVDRASRAIGGGGIAAGTAAGPHVGAEPVWRSRVAWACAVASRDDNLPCLRAKHGGRAAARAPGRAGCVD